MISKQIRNILACYQQHLVPERELEVTEKLLELMSARFLAHPLYQLKIIFVPGFHGPHSAQALGDMINDRRI